MMRLIGAETHRWMARRGLWVSLLGAFGVIALMCFSLVMATRPPSGADVELGRKAFAEQHAYWVDNHEADRADCLKTFPDPESDKAREACRMEEPREEWYIPQPMIWKDAAGTAATAGAGVGGLFMLLMAASFWGAEFRSGSLATWLTFVPSRPRVWASKMAVAALAGAVVTAALTLIGLATAWLAISLQQGPDAVGSLTDPLQVAGRGVLFGAMMAVVGGGLALVFRSTVAAVAVPLGYLFLQGMLGIMNAIPGFDKLTALLPENNVRAFLEGGYTYSVPIQRATAQGVEVDYIEKTITLLQGTIYLLVFVALAAFVSVWVFQRRDVTE